MYKGSIWLIYDIIRRISPKRTWNFVEINVPYPEALEQRQHIIDKMYPLDTVMDLVRIEIVHQERKNWYSTCTIFN